MDTDLLKTFLEVSRTRHFGQAAESLYLTQSAVSFRIRQLETILGVVLFTRHRNNIRLTPAGERLLPYAEQLIETWLKARKEVPNIKQTEISIGATALFWETLLSPWLELIYKQHEEIQIEARIAPRALLIQQLHERKLDLSICLDPPKYEGFSSHIFGSLTLQLFRHPASKANTKRNYLQLDWGTELPLQEMTGFTPSHPPILNTASVQLVRQLLATTGGMAFLPTPWASQYPDLIPDPDIQPLTRPIYAIWRENNEKSALIQHLIAMMSAEQ